jgi:CRISPR-associated protein Cas1
VSNLSDDDVAAIVADQDAAFAKRDLSGGVAVVDGMGVSVLVRLGHLAISDGLGETRRERRFPRAAPPEQRLRTLVVTSQHGMVSLDALAWCRATGVEVVGIDDWEGEPTWATLPTGPRDGRITRALALAGATGTHPLGLAIGSYLLASKVRSQAGLLRRRLTPPPHGGGPGRGVPTWELLDELAGAIEAAPSIDDMRLLEAQAAALYFGAWSKALGTAPRFAPRDRDRVPASWASFDGRRSAFGAGRSNRRATHPTNAVLNYLNALVRARATTACHILGLSPELAVVHADMARRDSLACDLQEPVRAAVEEHVLDLFEARTFRRADFLEGPDGEVRLGMGLRQELAATSTRWGALVAPVAEHVRGMLAQAVRVGGTSRLVALGVAPISGTRRKKVAAEVVARKRLMRDLRERRKTLLQPSLWRCPQCGGEVPNPRRVRCNACISADPRQRPELRKSRARAISARRQAEAGWSRKHHPGLVIDKAWAVEVLRPALGTVKLGSIVETCQVAKSTASGWRAGRHIPHPMQWPALARLVGVELPEAMSHLTVTVNVRR